MVLGRAVFPQHTPIGVARVLSTSFWIITPAAYGCIALCGCQARSGVWFNRRCAVAARQVRPAFFGWRSRPLLATYPTAWQLSVELPKWPLAPRAMPQTADDPAPIDPEPTFEHEGNW